MVDICSPGMKQNCEKMLTQWFFSWRGWWGWVNFLYEVKEYYTLHCCPKVDFKPLSPFAHKVDICSPGMKQNCEKMLNQRFFSWRGWWGWVNFLYEVKEYYTLHCCPKVDFKPLSPFAHKVDICSPGMKQNCEKMLNQRFFSWRGWWGWVNFLCEVKEYYMLHCGPEVDLKPLSPFAPKVDICSPWMKQNCEKMPT